MNRFLNDPDQQNASSNIPGIEVLAPDVIVTIQIIIQYHFELFHENDIL